MRSGLTSVVFKTLATLFFFLFFFSFPPVISFFALISSPLGATTARVSYSKERELKTTLLELLIYITFLVTLSLSKSAHSCALRGLQPQRPQLRSPSCLSFLPSDLRHGEHQHVLLE